MIYAVRPMLCRSITSTDPGACRDAVALTVIDESPRVEMNLFQKNLVETVYRALAAALKASGFDNRPKRLTAAVLGMLSSPEHFYSYIRQEDVSLQ